jgi:hypothetical protein
MKRIQTLTAFLLLIFVGSSFFKEEQNKYVRLEPYLILEQTFNPFSEMGDTARQVLVTNPEMYFSPQIRLWEYKEFLNAMREDSSNAYYKKLLPDTSMCSSEAYAKYFYSDKYNNDPVLGVSLYNAMRYMRWLTEKANTDTIYDTVYMIPTVIEWLAGYRAIHTLEYAKEDINVNYSDWTLNSFDESTYDFLSYDDKTKVQQQNRFDYSYVPFPNDHKVLKRNHVMGNSFHRQFSNLYSQWHTYCYGFEGYAYVSFRYVRKVVSYESVNGKMNHPYQTLKKWSLVW